VPAWLAFDSLLPSHSVAVGVLRFEDPLFDTHAPRDAVPLSEKQVGGQDASDSPVAVSERMDGIDAGLTVLVLAVVHRRHLEDWLRRQP
jgi:hypothetical protein